MEYKMPVKLEFHINNKYVLKGPLPIQCLGHRLVLKQYSALTGVAQWVGCRPGNRKFSSLSPGHGTCLGYGPGSRLGACERQLIDVYLRHGCFSPLVSPFLPLSLRIHK